MWISTGSTTVATVVWVSWFPKNKTIHYPELYASLWDYLRRPPNPAYALDVSEYLAEMIASGDDSVLHRHRIAWVLEWVDEMLQNETTDVIFKKETPDAMLILRSLVGDKKNQYKYAYKDVIMLRLNSNEQANAAEPNQGGVLHEHAFGAADQGTQA